MVFVISYQHFMLFIINIAGFKLTRERRRNYVQKEKGLKRNMLLQRLKVEKKKKRESFC